MLFDVLDRSHQEIFFPDRQAKDPIEDLQKLLKAVNASEPIDHEQFRGELTQIHSECGLSDEYLALFDQNDSDELRRILKREADTPVEKLFLETLITYLDQKDPKPSHVALDVIALQVAVDADFDQKIEEIQKEISDINFELENLTMLSSELRPFLKEGKEFIDLSKDEKALSKIHEIQEKWPSFFDKETPCPFSEDLNPKKVTLDDITAAITRLDAAKLKKEKEVPMAVLKMERITKLNTMTTDILKESLKYIREFLQRIQANSGKG